MNKTSFLFVLNEVFEEVGGNAEGKVSHGVFLQCSSKKLEMKSHQIQKNRFSIRNWFSRSKKEEDMTKGGCYIIGCYKYWYARKSNNNIHH